MTKVIPIKATLSDNVNSAFRISTRLYHIIHRHHEVKNYPVIINNYNRLEWLEFQIEWLLSVGQKNIHIIDNASTYPPLLAYYKKTKAMVYMLDRNVGHEAFWRTHLHQRFGKYYHVYTDPDVLPDENTPRDFMYYFKDVLNRYPQIQKVGFGLKTDDLPDHYKLKSEVVHWEAQFYTNAIEPQLYKSPVDTTFSLYRPSSAFQCWDTTLRTGKPYMLRHMPWYENSNNLSAESLYYSKTAGTAGSWNEKSKTGIIP